MAAFIPLYRPTPLRESPKAPSQTAAPPPQLHGMLGDWEPVCKGLNICSIVCSSIVILSTIIFVIYNRRLLTRPSLRLSTSIAACDMIYSVCQVFTFNNSFMIRQSEIRLRAMLWMMAGASVTFVMLSVCMGIQLLLTVLTRKAAWAKRTQPYYEVASFFFGYTVTHPYMYMFSKVVWVPSAQFFHIRSKQSEFFRNLWLIQWAWILSGIVFLFFIAIATYLKMSRVWTSTKKLYSDPVDLDRLTDPTIHVMDDKRRRYIRSVTLRVTCYPLIPVITQIWLAVGNMMAFSPYWLFVMSSLMPSTQGTLNFLVYLMNPALDTYRHILLMAIRGRYGRNECKVDEFRERRPTMCSELTVVSKRRIASGIDDSPV